MNLPLGTAPFWERIHSVLMVRLLIVMVLFTVCRVLFFYFNPGFFPDITPAQWLVILLGGIRFDLVAVLYTNVLYILLVALPFTFKYRKGYQSTLDYLFILTNSLALLANCADFIYYRFTIKRTTWSVVREFSYQNNLPLVVGGFIGRYWIVALIWAGMVALLFLTVRKVRVGIRPKVPPIGFFFLHTTLMLLIATLFLGGVRGGFKHSTRPITLSNAGEYVQKPKEMFLVLNTPFCIYKTLQLEEYERIRFYDNEQRLSEIYTPIHEPAPGQPAFQPLNVVVLIWESLGKEIVGSYNHDLDNGTYRGYTPFMDSLLKESKVFWYSFANGAKSIEAMPSILTSIPGIKEPFVLTRYTDNHIYSLPRALRDKGYHTSFFHGAPNGSMGFQAFANLTGFEQYYGKNEYNNDADFDGIWGIWDEEFLQFWERKLSSFKEPFFSTLFTVSSHDPYQLPERYKGKYKTGPLPVYETMGYTDEAVEKFFREARKKPWFKNTLFIISADHSNTHAYHPEYKHFVGNFSIPIVFYRPSDETLKGVDTTSIVQQIDIMPSVLGYLHYDKPFFAFGKNVFDPHHLNFAVNYDAGYQWFRDSYILQFDGKKSVGLYNYRTDKLLKNNLVNKLPSQQTRMEKEVKAFIQQYNNRMLDDHLTVK